ncbi:uncharacterized protein LOC113386392 [Ctenocephalides felis]|uniref:uncharacterized protein LOC113386392 n=1 Tax=Ctenocephalides felis TaxID=7515 RepID=UPI000E6E16AF|nr:uncharacterized protein LOC113386392 [Ctenocephalides felis]
MSDAPLQLQQQQQQLLVLLLTSIRSQISVSSKQGVRVRNDSNRSRRLTGISPGVSRTLERSLRKKSVLYPDLYGRQIAARTRFVLRKGRAADMTPTDERRRKTVEPQAACLRFSGMDWRPVESGKCQWPPKAKNRILADHYYWCYDEDSGYNMTSRQTFFDRPRKHTKAKRNFFKRKPIFKSFKPISIISAKKYVNVQPWCQFTRKKYVNDRLPKLIVSGDTAKIVSVILAENSVNDRYQKLNIDNDTPKILESSISDRRQNKNVILPKKPVSDRCQDITVDNDTVKVLEKSTSDRCQKLLVDNDAVEIISDRCQKSLVNNDTNKIVSDRCQKLLVDNDTVKIVRDRCQKSLSDTVKIISDRCQKLNDTVEIVSDRCRKSLVNNDTVNIISDRGQSLFVNNATVKVLEKSISDRCQKSLVDNDTVKIVSDRCHKSLVNNDTIKIVSDRCQKSLVNNDTVEIISDRCQKSLLNNDTVRIVSDRCQKSRVDNDTVKIVSDRCQKLLVNNDTVEIVSDRCQKLLVGNDTVKILAKSISDRCQNIIVANDDTVEIVSDRCQKSLMNNDTVEIVNDRCQKSLVDNDNVEIVSDRCQKLLVGNDTVQILAKSISDSCQNIIIANDTVEIVSDRCQKSLYHKSVIFAEKSISDRLQNVTENQKYVSLISDTCHRQSVSEKQDDNYCDEMYKENRVSTVLRQKSVTLSSSSSSVNSVLNDIDVGPIPNRRIVYNPRVRVKCAKTTLNVNCDYKSVNKTLIKFKLETLSIYFLISALIDVILGRGSTRGSGGAAKSRSSNFLPWLCCFLLLGMCCQVDANGGEVERLLREYRQNQELVRNIGAHYYQIIYPVQLRHHEKMGISTREIGSTKLSQRTHQDGGNYQGGTRGRSRTGKHFHRTSLLIKAFNHKFRLDLELNTQLLAPNIIQKHFLATGAEQESRQEIEHCYYHGTVKDYPGASAAFHTCNGVSGVIHVGNETFVIHPFYGGDLSQKHPHVIFEARTKANKGCANSGRMELRGSRRDQKFYIGVFKINFFLASRSRRDVREATKYIETALVIDKAMFDKRNGSTRAEVVHDAIQVANIADLYFRTLNTRVSVVYVETWQGSDQAVLDRNQDISRALYNFNDYTSRNLYKVEKDTTQLLTGETFLGGESGMAEPRTVCTPKSVGISVDINTYEPHLLAGTVAHMIGHNIGMGHDDGREQCFCRDWHGCIMAQSIVGLENVQPYKFSECSRSDYIKALRQGDGMCLMNKPNELEVHRNCGNGVVEDGEECDCGLISECEATDPCCDAITCKLKKEAECAAGPCCDNCRLVAPGTICRHPVDECDLPEHCTGESGACPKDVHMRDGVPCGGSDQAPTAFCFAGVCPTLAAQCSAVWGYGATPAGSECYEQFNSRGSLSGHCGYDSNTDGYVKCARDHVRCGSLQCSMGTRHPVLDGMVNQSKTIISIKGIEYECKTSSGRPDSSQSSTSMLGLVRDGTSCGTGKMCLNQTCVRVPPSIMGRGNCPVGLINNQQSDPGKGDSDQECSGNGVCTNMDKCYCYPGWRGADCSERDDLSLLKGGATGGSGGSEQKPPEIEMKMEKKETAYENYHGSNTVFLVGMLMSVVGGVFVTFALMALCYRSVVVHKNFALCLRRKSTSMPAYRTDPPYAKKMAVSRHHSGSGGGGDQQHMGGSGGHQHGGMQPGDHRAMSREDLAASLDGVAKMLSFANAPSYRADSQRVLFRPMNHTGAGSSRFQDHKLQQQMKRLGVGSGSEEDPGHLGELTCNGTLRRVGSSGVFVPIPNGTGSVVGAPNDEETVSFIDLPLVRGAAAGERVPEKGILKKHYSGGGGDRWVAGECCDSQSDNGAEDALSNAGLTQAETLALSDMLSGLHRHHHRSASGSQTPTANLQGGAGTNSADVERALRSLNGYHDDIIEALRGASAHRGDVERSGSQRDLQDVMNATGQYIGDHSGSAQPIRIRNLEDLIRQLEHHSARHALSPSGSEMDAGVGVGGMGADMAGDVGGRLAPPQGGHMHGVVGQGVGAYRVDSAACSESSQG